MLKRQLSVFNSSDSWVIPLFTHLWHKHIKSFTSHPHPWHLPISRILPLFKYCFSFNGTLTSGTLNLSGTLSSGTLIPLSLRNANLRHLELQYLDVALTGVYS